MADCVNFLAGRDFAGIYRKNSPFGLSHPYIIHLSYPHVF
ncbi:hypothetical protein Cst_c23810 [Thermoclostridium stercorarium subsp. stercorarium DSM 8532]|uniref:Uncharacterized protein n=1 Tax=Thermoclostridium stercorarium (strain ATCC 35414 / DSM 8532 / NCIMB 11754) TaxID=1121335 RepID=L7VSJ1_THES1|nr:hypothetical protein Cst_c23810 [Thermoclostridium stercorarium subsp. stercorarium DSM 8532]